MPLALDPVADSLLAGWRAWALPGGEEAARRIQALEWTEEGELRSSPKAKWIPFTARMRLEAGRTSFRWDAVLGTGILTRTAVTDACDERHGWSVAKAAGVLPVARVEGPEVDRGQIQRYLADLGRCPTALLLHPSLEAASAGGRWLRPAFTTRAAASIGRDWFRWSSPRRVNSRRRTLLRRPRARGPNAPSDAARQ